MTKETISVLFMDDEPASGIVQTAADWMTDEGFAVDLVDSMTRAVESYYNKFYDVFVLDIDMSHIPDDAAGDGVNVLKRFISLHNQTRVIMFSGAGTTPHWFAAANAHCYAYVHKNEKNSVRRLIELIRKSRDDAPPVSRKKGKPCPRHILLYDPGKGYEAVIRDTVKKSLGDHWEIHLPPTLEDMAKQLQAGTEYGMALLFQDVFDPDPGQRSLLADIFSRCHTTQIIAGCTGKDDYRYAILFIANLHPFRMVNTADARWPEHLGDFLKKAETWYGQREIFPADPDALKRMNISLPPESLEAWEYAPEDEDVFPEAFTGDHGIEEEDA